MRRIFTSPRRRGVNTRWRRCFDEKYREFVQNIIMVDKEDLDLKNHLVVAAGVPQGFVSQRARTPGRASGNFADRVEE